MRIALAGDTVLGRGVAETLEADPPAPFFDSPVAEICREIDIALHRFAEYHDLEGAFGRRAITERAKGILMERHSIDEEEAFKLLRDQARPSQRKVVDIAAAVLTSHILLPSKSKERVPARQAARTLQHEPDSAS